ncbi:MAG: c-type cytochrome [Methylococcaceae bacterium]|nr:c-type cytochrome [Methylococcaceae bacterium]MDZ4157859.1 c-type cytochrome [Methylococcales bacterium]MDP2392364.1 c-type cytochrome [Methylococcaceae bacterium]MDP3021258.1 c-type cytochrome [Methylococcaceae bacterium]MDP3390842.1 c-type cytochrome [Methylococcaceae bacterium]
MKNHLLALSITLALTSVSSLVQAQGNIAAGKQKATACAACHGEDGNSLIPTFPKLAQQHSSYLAQQLRAFKEGVRKNAVMSPLAMALSDEDIAEIADYYAAQKVSANAEPTLPPSDDDDVKAEDGTAKKPATIETLLAQGGNLYRNGDIPRAVSACIACHGPYGEGNKPASFPALKSQHADYLIKALNDFKSDERSNNPENIMHMIAKKMTDEEIKAVSYKISTMK